MEARGATLSDALLPAARDYYIQIASFRFYQTPRSILLRLRADGIASQSAERNERALRLFRDVLCADTTEINVQLVTSTNTREHST